MALGLLGQSPTGNRRWDAWTIAMTLMLVISNLWIIPVSGAATGTVRARAPIAGGLDLRVLPIGDSITWGAQSSDSNGYRKQLFNRLVGRGNKVDFVGGTQSGDMSDPDHEGHRGFEISGITSSSAVGIYASPNIVLLHAGTNDMKAGVSGTTALNRLKQLIDLILEHAPDAVVLVCQIIPSTTADIQARVENFNAGIPGLVDGYGKKVRLVSMNNVVTTSDLADNLHPNDGGYIKMAETYFSAIEDADSLGLISKAGEPQDTPPDATSPENCKSTPSWYRVGMVAEGARVATSDGNFKPSWSVKRVIADGACPRERLHFMDLDGDGLKDYACVGKNGATDVWLNIPDAKGKSQNKWNKLGEIATGRDGRDGYGVMFADLNGDGRDDYIYVNPDDGSVSAWINRLKNEETGIWQWQELGHISVGVGATNETLQMVDLDGDGRADFTLVNQETGEYRLIGVIATGASATKNDKVFLGDFTGEGRADYILVGKEGKAKAFVNRLQEGLDEESPLVPRWVGPFDFAEGPEGAEQEQVRLVDMTGDGKVDYLLIGKDGKTNLWENQGTGGKYQPGEGVILCDLDGDGTSDYFWVNENGNGWGYLNAGKGRNLWNDLGQIAYETHRRDQIRMAVLTKSGRAYYVVVDDETGRAEWYENLGEDGAWAWRARGVFAEGPVNTLKEKFGMVLKGKNVRFADLDGDGLEDYLYVNERGAVMMWQHLGTNPPTWGLPRLVADGVDIAPEYIQFADTNGDGRLDYVVIGRTTGSARSWHHLGFREDGSIRWNTPLSFADGVGTPGRTIRITEMTGDQRADYVSINLDSGTLTLWHNRCWPIGDDDEDGDGSGGTTPDPVEEGPKWTDLDCSAKPVTDASYDPDWRWNELLCPQAWFEAVEYWHDKKDKPSAMNFSREINNFFHGNEQMECGNMVEENQCYHTEICNQQNDPGAATFMILNSFRMVSSTLWNLFNQMEGAAGDVRGSIGRFSKIFAPVLEDDGLSPLIILDIIALGYGGVMAPFWNKWAKGWKFPKDHAQGYDTLKVFTNGMTYQGITLAKDLIGSGDPLDTQNLLEEQLGWMVSTWKEANRQYAEQLFNGSNTSIERLGNIIADGKVIGPDSPPPASIVEQEFKKALYALLIPLAWRVSEQKLNPFIIDAGLSCEDAPKDTDLELRLDEDTLKNKFICDKKADRAYYLVGAVDPDNNCYHGGNTGGYGCKHFQDLPGADLLTGKTSDGDMNWWALVSREDIVFGSLATFKANGNKNVRSDTDTTDWNSPEDWDETLGT
ncbi:hypothetical protein BDV12DRAFT_198425 [Aspergillus spectabilis]